MFTPVQLEVLLAYYYRRERQVEKSIATGDATTFWLRKECIQLLECSGMYECTQKGCKLVTMLCLTPFPECIEVWVDPRKEEQWSKSNSLKSETVARLSQ